MKQREKRTVPMKLMIKAFKKLLSREVSAETAVELGAGLMTMRKAWQGNNDNRSEGFPELVTCPHWKSET